MFKSTTLVIDDVAIEISSGISEMVTITTRIENGETTEIYLDRSQVEYLVSALQEIIWIKE